MNGSYIANVNRRLLPVDWWLLLLACNLAALKIYSSVDALISEVDCSKLVTEDDVSNCVLYLAAPFSALEFVNSIILREPGQIFPPKIGSKAVTNVTLSLPACEVLWTLSEQECTFRPSTTWPSPGLEAGHAYLFYQKLRTAVPTAERVNFTCPPADWDTLLATRRPAAPGVAPCGTATVSTGQELVEALQQLQPNHARVMVTLAANISLPTEPTPQRLAVTPDDSQPLMLIYRNVTLVGTVTLSSDVQGLGTELEGGVELDLRMRRNAFDLVTPRQQPRPDQQGELAVLTVADLRLVNVPPGPTATWPLGLLSTFHSYIKMDRSGSGGLQGIGLRAMMVFTMGEMGYQAYWYSSMVSLVAEARARAAWLRQISDPIQLMPAADVGYVAWGHVGDYLWAYNSTVSPQPLRTAPSSADFDLWSLEDELASPLPPASFAVARNATQLLTLMQESWTGGPRVILVVDNITLNPAEWPQSGPTLSYNLTLCGPVAGAPVWLDTGGMALVRSTTVAAAAVLGSGVVTLRLLRLRVVGLPPPLLAASRDDVAEAAAQGAFRGSQGLEVWWERCLEEQPSVSNGFPVGSSTTILRVQLQKCVLEVSPESLELLRRYAKPDLCTTTTIAPSTPSAQPAVVTSPRLSSPAVSSAATAVCSVLVGDGATRLDSPLMALMDVAVEGEVDTDEPDTLVFVSATLSGVHLVDTTAVAVAELASRLVDLSACSLEALLLATGSYLAASISPNNPSGSGGRSHSTATIGGAVGGAVAAILLALAVVLLVWKRKACQRPYSSKLPPPTEEVADDPGFLASSALRDLDVRSDIGVQERKDGASGQLDVRHETGGQEGPPGKWTAAGARGKGDGPGMASEVCLTFSCENAKETMAEAICLGPGAPAILMRTAPAAAAAPAPPPPPHTPPAAAAGEGAQGSDRMRGNRGGSSGRKKSEETVAGDMDPRSASGPGSGARPRADLRSSVRKEIESNMRRCLSLMGPASSVSNGGGRMEPKNKLLGKGAYGIVYKDFWRGLPAAVKVVVMGPADAARRRERLTWEAGLTLTLYHPHVVPTYHYHIDVLLANDEQGLPLGAIDGRMGAQELPGVPTPLGPPGAPQHAGLAGWAQPHPPQRAGEAQEGGGAEDLTACVRLRLVMQYCEGGTLGSALARGRFGSPVPLPPLRLPSMLAMSVPGRPSGEVLRRPDAGAEEATAYRRGLPPAQGELAATAAGYVGTAGAALAPHARVDAVDPSTGAETAWSAWPPGLTWQDMRLASNLLFSLLAARDVAAALEYLHAANVVHGDLTENNVLLKAVVPHFPTNIHHPPHSAPQLPIVKDSGMAAAGCGGAVGGAILIRRPETADKAPQSGEAHAGQATQSLDLAVDAVVNSAGGCGPAAGNVAEDPGKVATQIGAALEKRGLAVVAPDPSSDAPVTEQIGTSSDGLQWGITRTESSTDSLVAKLLGRQPPNALPSGSVKPPTVTIRAAADNATHTRAGVGVQFEGSAPSTRSRMFGGAGDAAWRNRGQQAMMMRDTAASNAAARRSMDSNRPPEYHDRQLHTLGVLSTTPSLVESQEDSPSQYASGSLALRTAQQLCSWCFKISDFGLSVQILEPSQTHISDMKQGTPFFAAPEVVESGHLSPAADVYSFGVLLWLLLHAVSLTQIRHLLPASAHVPIAPLLLRHTNGLPASAVALLRCCLARHPTQRPSGTQLRTAVEGLLQDAAGPELWLLLQRVERQENPLSSAEGP